MSPGLQDVQIEMTMNVREHRGFTITELLVVIALFSIIAAIGVPMVLGSLETFEVGGAARAVQGELQTARLKAVSANRAMRVRFNCPVATQYRMVELIGTPQFPDTQDSSANRCSLTAYPFPVTDVNALTRPNNDGPIRRLKQGMTFTTSQTVEFWPDGTAHADTGSGNPWPAIAATVAITVKGMTKTKTITVNGVGKVQMQ